MTKNTQVNKHGLKQLSFIQSPEDPLYIHHTAGAKEEHSVVARGTAVWKVGGGRKRRE